MGTSPSIGDVDHRIQLPSTGEVSNVDRFIDAAQALISQLDSFRDFLVRHKQDKVVETCVIRTAVKKELELLNRVKATLESDASSDGDKGSARQNLRSSNLGYYLAVWEVAKNCTALLAFRKVVYWDFPTSETTKKEKQQSGTSVDLIVQDGQEWIKVSTTNEHRLMMELAEKGFGAADSDDEGDEELDEDDMVEVLHAAHGLRKASEATRVRYKHPQVHFVFPKITSGHTPQVDKILEQIRATGATIHCGSLPETRALAPLDQIFNWMLPQASHNLTPTVNVDCTILLALVSDLSHYGIERILRDAEARVPGGELHPFIRRQLEKECEEQLLEKTLYPLLKDHDLICTEEAAARMRQIVEQIGTDDEKSRTAIFMGDLNLERQALHQKLGSLSIHDVPSTLILPIRTVMTSISFSSLPPIAEKVARYIESEITKSAFLYSWQTGTTVITSNRAAAKLVESLIHNARTDDGGPDLYVVATARSLVGKEKRGAPVSHDGSLDEKLEDLSVDDA